jgi:hypothetical protein
LLHTLAARSTFCTGTTPFCVQPLASTATAALVKNAFIVPSLFVIVVPLEEPSLTRSSA